VGYRFRVNIQCQNPAILIQPPENGFTVTTPAKRTINYKVITFRLETLQDLVD
jgi:hypothetical protein